MKNLLGFLFVCALFTLVSCGSDSDCTTDSFVGSYTGEISCDGTSASGTIMITRVSESQILLSDPDGSEFTLDVDGCNAIVEESLLGLGSSKVELTLDGDQLRYSQEGDLLGIVFTCSGTLDKQ